MDTDCNILLGLALFGCFTHLLHWYTFRVRTELSEPVRPVQDMGQKSTNPTARHGSFSSISFLLFSSELHLGVPFVRI